ncbi:unnamed protein product [Lampetra planeri]
MTLWVMLRAIVPRLVFAVHALACVWRVAVHTQHRLYWLLLLLVLLLPLELIVTLVLRKGKDYKWLSLAILLYLINVVPAIWLLEVRYFETKLNETCSNATITITTTAAQLPVHREPLQFKVKQLESTVNNLLDSNEAWILCIHQMLLLLLIIGRWLLPTGTEVSREKLSQLLLEFIGTAGDILEFKTETMQDSVVRCNRPLFYCIMAVWTWSLIQFPLVIKVHQALPGSQEQAPARGWRTLVRIYSTDLWAIVISVFIQDGPFLVVRLLLLIHFGVLDQMQMLIFFTIKNVLVLMLQAYRLVVIYGDYRALCLSGPDGAPSPRGRQEGKSPGEVPSDAGTLATDDSFTMTITASNSEKMRECP